MAFVPRGPPGTACQEHTSAKAPPEHSAAGGDAAQGRGEPAARLGCSEKAFRDCEPSAM